MTKNFFMWCTIVNYGLLMFWSLFYIFWPKAMARLLEKGLQKKVQNFDSLNIWGLTFYKILIIVFNLVPWISLSISG